MQTILDRYVIEYDELCTDSVISKCLVVILVIVSICGIVMGSFELAYTNRSYPLGIGLLIPGVVILGTLWLSWCIRHSYNSVTPSPQRQPEASPDLENPMYGVKTPVKPVIPSVTGLRKVVILDEDGSYKNPMHQEEELPSPSRRNRSLSSDSGRSPKKEKKEKKERRRSISDSDLTLKKEMQDNPMLSGNSKV